MTTTQDNPTTTNFPAAGTYSVDALHSSVSFVVRHLVAAKVRGNFKEFDGTIVVGATPETSSITATVQAGSVSTGNEQRDGHLLSPDFFDLENHPTWELKSTKIAAKGADKYQLTADLTIRGVTKSVDFDLEYLGSGPGMAEGVTVAGFEARAEIDRRDFNVNFEASLENGNLVVSNKVIIEIAVEAHKQA